MALEFEEPKKELIEKEKTRDLNLAMNGINPVSIPPNGFNFDKWWDSLTDEQQKKESDEAIRWYEER